MTTTLTVKGQVTIPKKVREALRLTPGDGVDFVVNLEGQVAVRKARARGRAELRDPHARRPALSLLLSAGGAR